MALVLGGFVFRGFEIPSNVRFPLSQRHHIHRQVGGGRVVNAMGPDPEPISWGGRFTGSNASSRVNTLRALTAAGRELPVVFASFMYMVLITRFDPDLTKPYDVYYQIQLTPTQPFGGAGGGGGGGGGGQEAGIAVDLVAAAAGAALAAGIAGGL